MVQKGTKGAKAGEGGRKFAIPMIIKSTRESGKEKGGEEGAIAEDDMIQLDVDMVQLEVEDTELIQELKAEE